ncbi:MAG: hypothetical protein NVS9B10_17870 [Nevskia sp.]
MFPVLFAVTYAGIAYGLVFFLQQRVNFAAQEGVRAAIAVDPAQGVGGSYLTAVTTAASTAVVRNFVAAGAPTSPAPARLLATVVSPDSPATGLVTVTVTYSLTTPDVLFPTVDLPGIGPIPVIPPTLSATVVGHLS